MKEKYINISNELNNKIESAEEMNKILNLMLKKIETIPPSTIRKYKDFSIPQNNLNTIIIFYEEFLEFMQIKNKILNKINAFNNRKDEIKEVTIQEKTKLEEYRDLNNRLDLIKKYTGIKMVDEEVLSTKKIMEEFVNKINKTFFRIFNNQFQDVKENLKDFSYFLLEVGIKDFLNSYVNLFTTNYVNSVKMKSPKDILENINGDMKNIVKACNILLPEEERKIVCLQISKTIPISLMPIISSTLYLWNQENNWKMLTNILKIYTLIDRSRDDYLESYKSLLPEIGKTISNLTIEVQKKLGVEKVSQNDKLLKNICKTINNIILFGTENTNLKCFNLGVKIRTNENLKTFFEPRLVSCVIKRMSHVSKEEIIKNLNLLLILKNVYKKIGDDEVSKLIVDIKKALINKWIETVKALKRKPNQTDFEILDGIKILIEKDNELFLQESFRDEFLKDLIENIEKETKVSKDALRPIMKSLYKK